MNVSLPTDFNPKRIAIKLKPKAEIFVKQGHPWIFETSIQKQNKEGEAGDVAVIFDRKKNKYLAIGLYDPHSPIRIKLLKAHEPVTINADFFRKTIDQAYTLRKELLSTDTNGYRLVSGENDGLPGLICDVYAGVAVIKLYSAIWIPYLQWIMDAVVVVSNVETVVLRMSRILQSSSVQTFGIEDGQVIFGTLDNLEVEFREHGLYFIANVIKGHKTGYFLDHRANRLKVGEMAEGKSVLDIFSYAGGFSTHAVVGGATEVVSIDISKQALRIAQRNVQLNVPNAPHKTMAIDAFEGMQQLIDDGKQFDIVVVDPPSFAKMAADIPVAKKSYVRLAKLAIQLVKPNGIAVMASCSSRISREAFFETIESGFDEVNRAYYLLEKTYHDSDHPITFPEGAYLKTGYYHIT